MVAPGLTVHRPSSRVPLRSRLLSLTLRPPVLGFAVACVGLGSITSALTPSLPRRLGFVEELFDAATVHFAAGTAALLGFVLVLLGRGLARRRHSAYVAAVAVLALSVVTHVVKGLDVEEAAITAGVAVLLVRARGEFSVKPPPGRARRVLLVGLVLAVVDLTIGVLALVVGGQDRLRVPVKPGRLFAGAINLLGGARGVAHFHGVGHLIPLALVLLGCMSAGAVLLVALAPAADVVDDREALAGVRDLVNRSDGDTLDPFALRSDKRYVFSADGRAAVAYRCVAGVGLAAGDPVGAPDAFGDAIANFVAHCDARGWRPAFLGARSDRVPLYEAAGLRAEYLGEEAIVDAEHFSLDGRAMRGVRQAVNRTHNYGITTEIMREAELSAVLCATLRGIAERSRNGTPERGFSMALDGLLSGSNPDCVVVVARDAEGRPFAFQRYVACRGGAGLSLDAMRRDRVGPNGVNERMIVDAIEWAREHGIADVSLNFAFCKALIETTDLPPAKRVKAWIVRRLNPYFQIESLLLFNAKFAPRWVPRYVIYRSLVDLPAVAAAAASAEGFLPFERGHAAAA